MPRFLQHLLPVAIVLASLLIMFQVLTAPPAAFGLTEQAAVHEAVQPSEPLIALAPLSGEIPPPAPMPDPPLKVINGKIGRLPVYSELVSCGVAPSEVLCLTRAFKGVFDFRNARPQDEYQLCLTPGNALQKMTYKTSLLDHYVAVRTDDGAFRTYREEIAVEKKIVSRTFTIDSSLYQAVTAQGEGCRLVSAFADIFSWDIDFYLDTRRGDTIQMLFEKNYLRGRFVSYGQILAARYISRDKTYSAFYFDSKTQSGYYDENGTPLRKMFIRVPVKFGMRTSSFSTRRFHPVTKKYKRHTGIDYGAPHGTPIFATAGGIVEFSGWRGGYGKLVIVRHPNGYKTYYGHCSRLLVKNGTRVDQGQTIARVGSTGQATGPHVHYETRINNRPVDPNSIKTTKGKPLPAGQAVQFAQMVQTRMAAMQEKLFSEIRLPAEQ